MELTQYFIRSYAFKKESEQISIYEVKKSWFTTFPVDIIQLKAKT